MKYKRQKMDVQQQEEPNDDKKENKEIIDKQVNEFARKVKTLTPAQKDRMFSSILKNDMLLEIHDNNNNHKKENNTIRKMYHCQLNDKKTKW